MSEPKWTPGPYYRDGQTVYAKTASGEDAWSAYVGLDFGDAATDELEAVAQLFRAAPELYEAVSTLQQALFSHAPDGGPDIQVVGGIKIHRLDGEQMQFAINKCRAALAKAGAACGEG